MDRREFAIKVFSGIIAIVSTLFLKGCGGSSQKRSLLPSISPEPPVPFPQLNIKLQLLTPDGEINRELTVNQSKTVLDTIKQAFSYSRIAPVDDLSSETTIEGICGDFLYTVNGIQPPEYAGNLQLNSDSIIILQAF